LARGRWPEEVGGWCGAQAPRRELLRRVPLATVSIQVGCENKVLGLRFSYARARLTHTTCSVRRHPSGSAQPLCPSICRCWGVLCSNTLMYGLQEVDHLRSRDVETGTGLTWVPTYAGIFPPFQFRPFEGPVPGVRVPAAALRYPHWVPSVVPVSTSLLCRHSLSIPSCSNQASSKNVSSVWLCLTACAVASLSLLRVRPLNSSVAAIRKCDCFTPGSRPTTESQARWRRVS
jgi:hypothetical protein